MEEFLDIPDNLVYFSKDFVQADSSYQYCGAEMYAGDDLGDAIEEIHKKQSVIVQFAENHTFDFVDKEDGFNIQ